MILATGATGATGTGDLGVVIVTRATSRRCAPFRNRSPERPAWAGLA
ncbi:hypothetical protein R1T08_06660 [Streptomyces sp. SBC-4]|nr:hypothetical protein [Streptomyces sp. SBC-4]MDV5143957.1 hypothetical protein [Streptomyces sp. SBC-4]